MSGQKSITAACHDATPSNFNKTNHTAVCHTINNQGLDASQANLKYAYTDII